MHVIGARQIIMRRVKKYTRFWSEKSAIVDASMDNSGGNCNGYCVLQYLRYHCYLTYEEMLGFWCNCMSYCESVPLWSLICELKGKFKSCVQDFFTENFFLYLIVSILDLCTLTYFQTPRRSKIGIFGSPNLKFRLIAN